jgi:hypothetical protein
MRPPLPPKRQMVSPGEDHQVPLCFEVRINDGPAVISGRAGISVLSSTLTFISARNELEFRVGGLASAGSHDNQFIEWIKQDLKIGDQVSIRIVETNAVSDPIAVEREEPGRTSSEMGNPVKPVRPFS